MRFVLCLAIILFPFVVHSGIIEPLPENYQADKTYNLEDMKILMAVDAHKNVNQEIIYMMNNYSLEEMAQYAIRLNKADRQVAAAGGMPIPEKLSREVLSDKRLIAEYLRSRYDFIGKK